jgi:hypothetical protein
MKVARLTPIGVSACCMCVKRIILSQVCAPNMIVYKSLHVLISFQEFCPKVPITMPIGETTCLQTAIDVVLR